MFSTVPQQVGIIDKKISLKSETGSFDCCISGLCWVCKDKVSFVYHFVT